MTLVWTFNVSALTLTYRADLLKRVVLGSWNLLVFLVGLELAWSVWALSTGQPMPIVVAACWLGLNLLVTVNAARKHAQTLTSGQVVLLCSWWLGLLGMVCCALTSAGFV